MLKSWKLYSTIKVTIFVRRAMNPPRHDQTVDRGTIVYRKSVNIKRMGAKSNVDAADEARMNASMSSQ